MIHMNAIRKTVIKGLWVFFFSCFVQLGIAQDLLPKKGHYAKVSSEVLRSKSRMGFETTIENGFQFNEKWGIGAELGIGRLKNKSYLPISLNVNYRVLAARLSPFISTSVGYNFANRNVVSFPFEFNEGFTTELSLGLSFQLNERISVLSSLGSSLVRIDKKSFDILTCASGIEPGWCTEPTVGNWFLHSLGVQFGIIIQ